jgi:hypothetical protein
MVCCWHVEAWDGCTGAKRESGGERERKSGKEGGRERDEKREIEGDLTLGVELLQLLQFEHRQVFARGTC